MFSQEDIEVSESTRIGVVDLEDNSHLNASGFDKINALDSLPVVIFFSLSLSL